MDPLALQEVWGLVLVLTAVYLAAAAFNYSKRLPGPLTNYIPFLGHLPFLKYPMQRGLTALVKQYGPVFRLKLGRYSYVVIATEKAIEASVKHRASHFNKRPNIHTASISTGMAHAWEIDWLFVKQEAFLKSLKKARPSFINVMHEEAQKQTEIIEKYVGFSFDPFQMAAGIIMRMVYRMSYGKLAAEETLDIQKLIDAYVAHSEHSSVMSIFNVLPWLRFFMRQEYQQFLSVKGFVRTINEMEAKRRITEAQEGRAPSTDEIDLLTAHCMTLKEMNIDIQKTDVPIDEKSMVFTGIEDHVRAAGDFGPALYYIIMNILSTKPDVQDECYKEIANTPFNAPSDYQWMKKMLPYTTATFLEIIRYSTVAPVLRRELTSDYTHGAYTIPKGTWILVDVQSINTDPDIWPQPEKFNPKRFLTQDGEVDGSLESRVSVFGYGLQRCVGATFAYELNMIPMIALIRDFKLRQVEKAKGLRGGCAIVPDGFKLQLERRPTATVATENGL